MSAPIYPSSAELARFRSQLADAWHADARHVMPFAEGAIRLFIHDAMRPRQGAVRHELDYGIGLQDRGRGDGDMYYPARLFADELRRFVWVLA